MTTREEWTYTGSEIWKAGEVAKGTAPRGVWSVSVGSGVQHLGFDPTPTEARAALRMANNVDTDHKPYTREAVHAFIREHGSVEECEAITPLVHNDEVCPGCGSAEGDGGYWTWPHGTEDHGWHETCFDLVCSRTEATPSGEPEPEWVSRARPSNGFKLTEHWVDDDGDHWVRVVAPNGRDHNCCLYPIGDMAADLRRRVIELAKAWGFTDPYAPAPVQQVEPRPLQVGDRVQSRFNDRRTGTVCQVHMEGTVDLRYDDGTTRSSKDQRMDSFTLVTPVQQDGEAGPAYAACDDCECIVALRGYSLCGDCCDCTSDTPGRCPKCGAWDVDTHGDEPPTPYVHEGATLTNPIGLPIAPTAQVGACPRCGGDTSDPWPVGSTGDWTCKDCHDADKPTPTAVILPFDAFMVAREREQSEPEPYDPREGDEVEVTTDYGSLPGVVMGGSRERGVTVRVRSTDGHEIVEHESAYYVTLVRRPGGV